MGKKLKYEKPEIAELGRQDVWPVEAGVNCIAGAGAPQQCQYGNIATGGPCLPGGQVTGSCASGSGAIMCSIGGDPAGT